MMQKKNQLREQLSARWQELWPQELKPGRPPVFEGVGKAAERLRRLKEYRLARVLAVTPEPCLLQVRINTLNDNKSLLSTTPGLKQGLIRVTPPDVPLPLRSRALRGWSLSEAGHQVRLPSSRPGKAELMVGGGPGRGPAGPHPGRWACPAGLQLGLAKAPEGNFRRNAGGGLGARRTDFGGASRRALGPDGQLGDHPQSGVAHARGAAAQSVLG